MNQSARNMPFLYGRVQMSLVPAAHTIDEVAVMITIGMRLEVRAAGRGPAKSYSCCHLRHPWQGNLWSRKRYSRWCCFLGRTALADSGLVVGDPVPDLELESSCARPSGRSNSKAQFSVFGVSWSSSNMKWPPTAETRFGKLTPSPQRAMFDLMNALIPEVAVARIPDPVPVVVKPVQGEQLSRGRAGPQIVVDTGWGRAPSAYGQWCRAI